MRSQSVSQSPLQKNVPSFNSAFVLKMTWKLKPHPKKKTVRVISKNPVEEGK